MFGSSAALQRATRAGRAVAAVAIVAGLASALAGCAGGSSAGTKSGNGISGTIRVSAETGQPYLHDAAKAFEKANPGTHVDIVESPSNTYQTTVRAQLAAKHAPDVMFVWGGSGNAMATKTLAQAGLIQDLSDRPWVQSIGETANSLVSQDGKVYALNTYANPTGVFYNTDQLKKLGVSVPTTFSEMLDFCRTVSSKGVVPIALGNQTGYLNTIVPLELVNTLVLSQNPKFYDDVATGKATWDDPIWTGSLRKSLDEYMQMNKAKCFNAKSTGYNDQAAKQLVATKKALGVDIISSSASTTQQLAPNIKFDMFEIPATDNPDDTVLLMNTGASYAVNKASTNLKTAIAFIDFLGEDKHLAEASVANYGVPYTASDSATVEDGLKGIEKLYRANKTGLWATNFWPNADVKQDMIAADQNLILGKGSIDDVMTAVQKALAEK